MPSTESPWGAFFLGSMTIIQFHPATKILLWLGFAIALQGLELVPLVFISIAVAALLLSESNPGSLLMVLRARWLLISLLLVYAFATPGDVLFPVLGRVSPTFQGLYGGAVQVWRLFLLLLVLGLLLRSCPREELLGGLYTLMRPFRAIGVNADRVAVRLWLTMQYAEQQPRRNAQGWWNDLRSSLDPASDAANEVTLELPDFTWRDTLVLLLSALLLGLKLW